MNRLVGADTGTGTGGCVPTGVLWVLVDAPYDNPAMQDRYPEPGRLENFRPGPGRGAPLRPPSAAAVQRAALLMTLALGAVVVTGGAVRLTGSGLGCPTWPHCTGSSVTAGHGVHWVVELSNRMLTIGVFLGLLTTVALVWLRRPPRRDLRLLASGLLGGYLGQAVLGGVTVLTRLNPLAVAAHFLLSAVLVWNALVLYRRCGVQPGPSQPVVAPPLRLLGRLVAITTGVVLVVGTLVTGSGPHAGARVDNRLPFPLRDIAQLHSDIVLFLVGLTLATVLALRLADAPRSLQRRGHLLLVIMVGQTVLGFTQYFLGLPSALVGLHIAGATLLWAAALSFSLDMWQRPALGDIAAVHAPAVREGGISVAVSEAATR